MKEIYVRNVPSGVSATYLRKVFSSYGTVQSVRLMHDGCRTGLAQSGHAIVEMENAVDADHAVHGLSRLLLSGRSVQVSEA